MKNEQGRDDVRRMIEFTAEKMLMDGCEEAEKVLRRVFELRREMEGMNMKKIKVMGIEIELQEDTLAQLEDQAADEGGSLEMLLEMRVAHKWGLHCHKGVNTTFSLKDIFEIDCIDLAGRA